MEPPPWVAADHIGEGAAAIDPEIPGPGRSFSRQAPLRLHVWLISRFARPLCRKALNGPIIEANIKREDLGHGHREVWQNRHAGVEDLSRLHDLRFNEMA